MSHWYDDDACTLQKNQLFTQNSQKCLLNPWLKGVADGTVHKWDTVPTRR